MTAVVLSSLKHSPGVTTAALALATAAGDGAIAIEADPSGGDVAARAGLPLEPGLVTLAAAARHGGRSLDLDNHLQLSNSGTPLLVAPTAARLALAAVSTIATRLVAAVDDRVAFVDLGRIGEVRSITERVPGADLGVLVAEPTVAGVEHLRAEFDAAAEVVDMPIAVLLIGERPYRSTQIEAALGLPVVGSLAVDPRGVAALYSHRSARRSLIVRSARSVLDQIRALASPLAVIA